MGAIEAVYVIRTMQEGGDGGGAVLLFFVEGEQKVGKAETDGLQVPCQIIQR
jgi:hypothetical protein